MASRLVGWVGVAVIVVMTGCFDFTGICGRQDESSVRIYLVNDSTTHVVAPKLGVCPVGMTTEPHYFVDPIPNIQPGESVVYTTRQIAGNHGVCTNADPAFSIGLCGWSYGTCTCAMTHVAQKFGGQIGFQFNCGDTIILRWTDTGGAGGTWTSEGLTAAGNAAPTADFQIVP